MTKRPADLKAMLCFDIYATNLAFGRVYKPLLDPLGLTYPQYLVLMTLWQGDNLTIGEIGTQVGLDTNTLTPLIKRLQAAGLVERTRDPDDERRVRVTLTPKGSRLREDARSIPDCVSRAVCLDRNDIDDLQRRLRGLRASLMKAAANEDCSSPEDAAR